MFVFADGESALKQDLIVVTAVCQIKMRHLSPPAREFALIKRQVARVTAVGGFRAVHGPIHSLHVVIAESHRPLRIEPEIEKRVSAPDIPVQIVEKDLSGGVI